MKKYENFELEIIYFTKDNVDCITASNQDEDGEFWGTDIFGLE